MERPAAPGPIDPNSRAFGADRPGVAAQSLPLAFELLAEIATGPTARVELCRVRQPKELIGKLVAVKRLHPHIAEDPQFYSMFVDEVWMTAALDHHNVTRVVGWGTDVEGTYLAVELVQGVSLARLMKTVFETREAFTERMVVYLGSEMCAGLGAAHQLRSAEGELLQLVHRDLTPGNVLLGFDGRVLIADFGLAKAKQRVTKTLTGLLKGHPHYMAPEQATEKPIDGRADLFSLGVVLFELFTGRHPWSGGNELEIFQVMANEPPADLQSLRPKLDRELASVVNRLLAKRPEDRFSSADEARDRLLHWLDTHGYKDDNLDAVARFVRRNAMRQMRWFERAVAGDFVAEATRAKSRLLGARARAQGKTATGASGMGAGAATALTSKSSPNNRRRAAVRRLAEDQTDVSDIGAKIEPPPPSGDNPDWAEEIPTVVQPNRQLPLHRAAHRHGSAPAPLPALPQRHTQPVLPVAAPDTEEDDMDGLPSFLDEDSSDNRTTSVKPQIAAAAIMKAKYGRTGTVMDLPMVVDPESEEVPTSPLRMRPKLPEGTPLRKLPPPPPERVSAPPPAPPETPTAPSKHPGAFRTTNRIPRTEGELTQEAERVAQLAARMRNDADQTAKLAAHRAVLAQLAAEAAQLMAESVRAFSTQGPQQAMALFEEAQRLESTIARGEVQTRSLEGRAGQETRQREHDAQSNPPRDGAAIVASVPAAPPVPGMPQGVDASNQAGASPYATPSFPTSPQQSERQSFAPPPPIDPRREPTAPSMRYMAAIQAQQQQQAAPPARPPLLSGEVFGVRVPVALGAALLIALAMVVLVWFIVS